MNLKAAALVLFTLLFTSLTYASPLDSIGVTKIDGKLHVKYLVSPGETIYGISTKFGVSVADLMEINPELENGLKVGQVINIPYNPQAMANTKKDDNKIVHKVQPGETFYSLSRKYNVSVDELMKMNEIQLKAGQEIVVGYKDQPTTKVASSSNPTTTNATTSQNTNSTAANSQTTNQTNVNSTSQKQENKNEVNKVESKTTSTPEKTTTKAEVSTNTNSTQVAIVSQPTTTAKTEVSTTPTEQSSEQYAFDPSRQQVLVIPFDPYLYFSDADDEIAARSNMPRTKVRQVFRRRLNAMLDPMNYETIHLLGGKAKDSLSDLNKIYSMVNYNYQKVVPSPYYKEPEAAHPVENKSNKNWIERQKTKLTSLTNGEPVPSTYETPQDMGSYFGVLIKNPEFFTYFNNKYSIDYYIFVSQFEVKTNYEHCLDRAAQNYDRTFTTHYSIFDKDGKQISGNKFKVHYNSNSNNIYQIVADNVEKIANRIIAELPPASH